MNDIEPVSVESNGRILTGVGVSEASLNETIARAAESDPAPPGDAGGIEAGRPTPDLAEPPKPSKGRERFSELTHERDEAKIAADQAKAERDALKARLDALEQAKPPSEPAKIPEPVTPIGKPKLDDYLDQPDPYAALAEALADWKFAAFERKQADKEAQQREVATIQQAVSSTWNEGRQAYQDFDAKLNQSTVIFSEGHQQAFLRSPDAPHVLYALASDEAFAKKVAAITDPVELGYTLAQISIPSRSGASPASPGVRASTVAPPPYQPVGAGSKTSSPPLDELAAKGDYEAYRARRAADRAAGARR